MPSVREKAGVPEEVEFQTKPEIALDQIRAGGGRQHGPVGVVLADAAYGINTEFRDGLTELGLQYVVGVQSLDRRSGNRANNRCRRQPRKPGRGAPPRLCSATQTINRFR